jgi:hypothetical protein
MRKPGADTSSAGLDKVGGMIITLIQAEEGFTASIFVADSREGLLAAIRETFDSPEPAQEREYTRRQAASLLAMVETHADWQPGRYILEPIEPWYEQWTLFIVDGPFGGNREY